MLPILFLFSLLLAALLVGAVLYHLLIHRTQRVREKEHILKRVADLEDRRRTL